MSIYDTPYETMRLLNYAEEDLCQVQTSCRTDQLPEVGGTGRNEHMRAATVCADHDAHLHRTLSPNDPGVERTGWILFRAYSAGRVWRRASSQPLSFYVWLR